jgi:hypothetical protein
MTMTKPILCLDFDGVIHSYASGWKGADVIPDPPVAGAMAFIREALKHFRVAIFSSRSNQPGGLNAMKDYIAVNSEMGFHDPIEGLEWPLEKPAAMVTIDDRALTFDGTWPAIEDLKAFQPWNKRPFGATGTFPQGVLNDTDEGALKIGVAYDKTDGLVHINFGKPVAWTAFPPEMATQLARALLKHAGAKTVEISF